MSDKLILFDDEKIIYQWKNPSSKTDRIRHNEAEEYAVVERKEASSGICIYAKFNDEWSPNPWSARALVRQILAENKRLRNILDQTIETFGGEPVQGAGQWETGLFCGLEDRNITDRYDACRYGYDKALDKVQEWIIDEIEDSLKQE